MHQQLHYFGLGPWLECLVPGLGPGLGPCLVLGLGPGLRYYGVFKDRIMICLTLVTTHIVLLSKAGHISIFGCVGGA